MWRLFLAASLLAATGCGSDRSVETSEPSIPPRVRLLTDAQYVNAVHDLLGAVDVPELETPGVGAHVFLREEVIAVEAPQLVQYRIAAEAIARQVAARPELVGEPEAFAMRAFRRPLDGTERAQLLAMERDGGAALVVEAVLQAPQFIYRGEVGPQLDAYELASELSFWLLDSIPDDGLWRAAQTGTLVRDEVLGREVDRLLALPRVQERIDDAVLDWLEIPRLLGATKNPTLFPAFTEALRQAMAEETRAFVHDVLWKRHGSLRELLTSRRTFANAELASIYGVELDRGQRAGILTHASVLTMLSTAQRESIIARGIYVGRHFTCLPEPGRPPLSAIVDVSGFTGRLSEAQFGHYRAANTLCASCHTQIDPPGWALEAYDGLGRARAADELGMAIQDDTTIELDGKAQPIRGAVQLAEALAGSAQVHRCVVDQFAHHAFGRAVTATELHARFESSDLDLVDLIRGIATSRAFRERGGAP